MNSVSGTHFLSTIAFQSREKNCLQTQPYFFPLRLEKGFDTILIIFPVVLFLSVFETGFPQPPCIERKDPKMKLTTDFTGYLLENRYILRLEPLLENFNKVKVYIARYPTMFLKLTSKVAG